MEIQAIIQLIKRTNEIKINPKEVTKQLAKIAGKSYYQILANHVNITNQIKYRINNYEKVIEDNASKQEKIRSLNTKMAQLKNRRIEKSKQFSESVQKKCQLIHFMEAGNFQKVIQLSKSYGNAKIEHLAGQLLQYRWFKQQAENMELHIPHKEKPFQWTSKGKLLKNLLETNISFRSSANIFLNEALNKLAQSQQHQLDLPKEYFRQVCRDSFAKLSLKLGVLKKVKQADEEANINLIMKATEQLGIPFSSQTNKDFSQIFEGFLQKIKNMLPVEDISMISPLVRTQSQQLPKQQQQSGPNFSLLFEQIKKMLRNQKVQLQDYITANLSPKDSILSCFKNMLAKLDAVGECLAGNKEILFGYMNAQSAVLRKLASISQDIRSRLQSNQKIERIQLSRIPFEDNLIIFQKNFNKFLKEFDKKPSQISSNEHTQGSLEGSRHKKQHQTEAEVQKQSLNIKSPDDFIQNPNKQIEELKEANKTLTKKYECLKQSLQQEYKLKDMHRKHNQYLVSRIKILEGVQSSILNTPLIDQNSNIVELQQRFAAINIQNSQLRNQLEEKEIQIKHYELSKSELVQRLEKQKCEEVRKWKKKYEDSQSEVEELYRQILYLNNILQERLFEKKSPIRQSKHISPKVQQMALVQQKQKPQTNQIQVQYSDVFIDKSTLKQQQRQQQLQLQISSYKQRINQLESKIGELNQQKIQKQKEYLEIILKEKKRFEEVCRQSRRQRDQLQQKMNLLSLKMVTHSDLNIKNLHLFALGSIFDQADYQQRLFLIENLTSYLGPIKKTRLLYRADNYNKVNFHKYIDKEKNIVMIVKTICGKLIAGYSEEAFDSNGTKKGYGMLLSLWGRKMFPIKEKKAISYDDYFIIFGNSELRIKSLEFTIFSNFGISNGYFDNRGEKVQSILGADKEREVDVSQYEFYALDLEY